MIDMQTLLDATKQMNDLAEISWIGPLICLIGIIIGIYALSAKAKKAKGPYNLRGSDRFTYDTDDVPRRYFDDFEEEL